MAFIKHGLLIAVAIVLLSCVYFVNGTPPSVDATIPPLQFKTSLACQPMAPREFPPIPAVPVTSEAEAADRDKTDTIRVEKIRELRDYAEKVEDLVEEQRIRQLETCK